MAAAIAFSTAEAVPYSPVTVTLSGFTAASAYVVDVTRGSGGSVHQQVTTDGAGGATFTFVPTAAGSHTFTAHLLTPANEATATLTSGSG